MAIFGNPPVKLRVSAADLAPLDDGVLATLGDAEQAVLQSHLAASEALLVARRAREDYERVAARRGGAKADVGLAKAGRSSARAHTDVPGTQEADRAIVAARAGKNLLDLQISWLKAEVAAADARAEQANEAAWAAEAELELQRARLLASHRERGDAQIQGFVKQKDACRKALETARHRAVNRRAEADRQKNLWQLAGAEELERV
jgi:hypothetical protein